MQLFTWYYPTLEQLKDPAAVADVLARLRRLKACGLYLMAPEAATLAEPQVVRRFVERCRDEGLEAHLGLLPFSEPVNMTIEMGRRRYTYQVDGEARTHGLCPAWTENRILALDRARRLMELTEPDGLHLDYVRYYFANSEVFGQNLEWEDGTKWIDTYYRCQCPLCQSERLELLGREATWWDEHHPAYVYRILHHRDENMRTFIKQFRELCGQTRQTLSVACRVQYLNRALIEGQDWVHWARRGFVDVVSPMNYNPCPQVVAARLQQNLRLLDGAPTRVLEGLARKSSAGEPSAEAFAAQVQVVKEAGVAGVAIFHLDCLTDQDLDRVAEFV